MAGKVGDQIRVASEKAGRPPSEGEIVEVIESPSGVHYVVRWADGHESDFRPTCGSARITSCRPRRKPKGG
jgi:hypothetical protein